MSNGFEHARMIPCGVEDFLLQKSTDDECPGMILRRPREEHLQPRPHSGHVPRVHDSFQGKVTIFVQSCVFVLRKRHECRIGSSADAEQAAFGGIENPVVAQFVGKTSHFVGELATAGSSFASLVTEVKL